MGHGGSLQWQDNQCVYSQAAKERCEETEDHLTIDKAPGDDDANHLGIDKCGQNKFLSDGSCLNCPDGQYQSASSHYLHSCSLCMGTDACAPGDDVCDAACGCMPDDANCMNMCPDDA